MNEYKLPTNIFIAPHPDQAPYGIKRVIEALYKYLPNFGFTVVDNEAEADIVNCHAMAFVETDKPVVYSSHGLYWADHPWPREFLTANQHMINFMNRADAITAVSEWVAHAISRGQFKKPHVIYHGVDVDEWKPGPVNSGYVLWNKARADAVCNPAEMNRLASMLPDVPFVSTIGEAAANVQITGVVDHDTMKDMVGQAGVYLSLARETMGIGTLEALARGVPVVGWDFGGNSEIITHGHDGFLVPYGDFEALALAVETALLSRPQLTGAARQSAVDKWQWSDKIAKYANLFDRVLWESEERLADPIVSVIVTAHNLEKYLPAALESVWLQSMEDYECIIVDDCSTDGTEEIGYAYAEQDGRFHYYKTPHNLKLSGARNFGIERARGQYILPLDADDMLAPGALDTLAQALDDDPFIHIAYGHLDVINEDGSGQRRNDWPFDQFNWDGQMAHLNQLPYSSMIRREVIVALGGYRERDYRAEDAAFWCRATSFGARAKKVTQDSTLIYRMRQDSKSAGEHKTLSDGDGDWTSWLPWRVGAATPDQGIALLGQGQRPFEPVTPFGAQGWAPNECWPVWSHHDPTVSIIIPVGPGHAHHLVDALDSVMAQTYPFWEAVVVNDSGEPLDLKFAPWARLVQYNNQSIAGARNAGIEAAKADLLLFLDVDDLLWPTAVEEMLKEYVSHDGAKYIYTDWYGVRKGEPPKRDNAKDYNRSRVDGSTHPITVLMRKEHALSIGGFDEGLPGWEDWEFFIKMAINGYCGQRLAQPLLIYRLHTGLRREQSLDDKDHTLPILRERYAAYFEGDKPMANCCGGNGDEILEAKRRLGLLAQRYEPAPQGRNGNMSGSVRLEYLGNNAGAILLKRANGELLEKGYRVGSGPLHKYVDATPNDAPLLLATGKFRQIGGGGFDLSQAQVAPAAGQPANPGVRHQGPAANPQTGSTADPVNPFPQVGEVVTAPDPNPFRTVGVDEPAANQAQPVPQPQPETPTQPQLDPTKATVKEIRAGVIGQTATQLKNALAAEKAGANRKSAVSYIETALEDARRVG